MRDGNSVPHTHVRGSDQLTATNDCTSSFGHGISETYAGIDEARYLGHGSGGDFYGTTSDLAPFSDDFAAIVGSYYVLGCAPDGDADGLRSLKVKVDRPGVRVRYPEKVHARPPEQELVDATVAALLSGSRFNPHDVSLTFDNPESSEPRVVTWSVDLLTTALYRGLLEVSVSLAVAAPVGTDPVRVRVATSRGGVELSCSAAWPVKPATGHRSQAVIMVASLRARSQPPPPEGRPTAPVTGRSGWITGSTRRGAEPLPAWVRGESRRRVSGR